MSKIHGIMDIGKRSMMNSQTALQTVGHNIANKGTDGASRQRVEIKTNEPIGLGNLRIGTGSRTAEITRVNNPYLEKQLGKEQSNLGYYRGKGDAMTRVEQVYNEQNNKSLNSYVSEFFNAFREFANSPESMATRTQVKELGDRLTKDFKRVDNQLGEIRNDLDQQIANSVSEVNEITREIAGLNEKIQMVQSSGGPANDERDRRDLLVKQLGEKLNIRYAEGNDGTVTISAGNSALLVSGYDARKLEVAASPETDTKGEGSFDILYRNSERGEPFAVTGQLTGGLIGGLLEVRDQVIGELYGDLDNMAYTLASTVNEVHSRGFDARNRQGGNFFEQPEDIKHAATQFRVSNEIMNDVERIAGAGGPNSPADNRVANAISQLQYHSIMDEGVSTLDDFYNSVVGKVGIQSRRAEMAHEAQKDVVKQLANIRESISGISLDEETTKLIEYQKAFDASARLIRTADEMFDTVLNLKRM